MRAYINRILYFSRLFKNIKDRWGRFSESIEEGNDDNDDDDDDNHDNENVNDDEDDIYKEEAEAVPTSGRSQAGGRHATG